MLQLKAHSGREVSGLLCSVEASSGGAGKCLRPPSMVGTPDPPCTSWCPSWGWGYSGPGWRPGGPPPGCCHRSSSGGATARCVVLAGPSTWPGRPPRSPSASWFCHRPPAPCLQSCSLARRRPAERPALPARRNCPRSSRLADQPSSPQRSGRWPRRRVWWLVSWWRSSDWRRLKTFTLPVLLLAPSETAVNLAHFYTVFAHDRLRRHNFPL